LFSPGKDQHNFHEPGLDYHRPDSYSAAQREEKEGAIFMSAKSVEKMTFIDVTMKDCRNKYNIQNIG